MNPIIISGDLHGSTHWKNGLDYFYSHPKCKFIFLGDYLDPYTRYEGINPGEAYVNFKEVLEFARNNPSRVVLLYGNHKILNFFSIDLEITHNFIIFVHN